MKQLEFKTKLHKTKKQQNAEIGGYTKLITELMMNHFVINFF